MAKGARHIDRAGLNKGQQVIAVVPVETIFALSSGRPPTAIAVARISGPQAGPALRALIGKVPAPRHATLAELCDPATGETIDEGLALFFPGPASATGRTSPSFIFTVAGPLSAQC